MRSRAALLPLPLLCFIFTALSQVPQLSIVFPGTVGVCGRFQVSQLGSFTVSSQRGLVAQNLRYLFGTGNREGGPFIPVVIPSVRIVNAVRTCESQALLRNEYNTVSVIVEYYCRGACLEQPTTRFDTIFTHLFSFACKLDNSEYATLEQFKMYPFVGLTDADVNTSHYTPGSCTLCTFSPAVRNNPPPGSTFNLTTGCLGCHTDCLGTGLGACTTNSGGSSYNATLFCCSYRHNDDCVQNCPAPRYSVEPSTFECTDNDVESIEFLAPTFTSLVPNYPNVLLSLAPTGPNISFHYTVPSGFREVVFTCIAVGRPRLPSVWWSRETARGASNASSNSRVIDSAVSVADLFFGNGFSISDAGRYHCVMQDTLSQSITLSIAYRNTLVDVIPTSCVGTVTSNTAYFETRVLNTSCSIWEKEFRQVAVASYLQNIFASGFLSRCENCVLNFSTVLIYPPACSALVEGGTVIRSKITTEHKDYTEAIYCTLKQWWQLEPLVIIAGNLTLVDRGCFFPLSSLYDTRECSELVTFRSQSFTTIGVSAGVGVITLIIGATITFAIIKRYTKRSSQDRRVPAPHHDVDYTRYQRNIKPQNRAVYTELVIGSAMSDPRLHNMQQIVHHAGEYALPTVSLPNIGEGQDLPVQESSHELYEEHCSDQEYVDSVRSEIATEEECEYDSEDEGEDLRQQERGNYGAEHRASEDRKEISYPRPDAHWREKDNSLHRKSESLNRKRRRIHRRKTHMTI